MSYKPTRYDDVDLMLKADRAMSNTVDPVVLYAQRAFNDLGVTPGLKEDGQFGHKTRAAVRSFQEACGLPVTGILDQHTYEQLDWRVYGEINGSWKPAPKTLTSMGVGGRAIKKGYNAYVIPPLRVNDIGQCREGQRGSDVQEAFIGRALGYEGAVDRDARNSTRKSRHAFGIGGDDMGDQDKDRVVEPHEIMQRKATWDYMVLRAQGFRAETYVLKTAVRTEHTAYRGRDRTSIMVIGNLKVAGAYLFPQHSGMKDVSWSAERNTTKSGTGTVHVAPFHFHSDFMPGAPYGSPW